MGRAHAGILLLNAWRLALVGSLLSIAPYAQAADLGMVLKKTFFGIRVMRVSLSVDTGARPRLDALRHKPYSPELAEQVSRAVSGASQVTIELVFLRDIGFGRWTSEVFKTLRCVADSGLIGETDLSYLKQYIPQWFAPLKDRGLEEGDALRYEIRPRSMHTTYKTSSGQTLVEHDDAGDLAHRSVLGSYFAPCSDFREPLVRSLSGSLSD